MSRTFTLAEAQGLVPWLQETFDSMEPLRAALVRAQARITELVGHMQSNGGSKARRELEEASQARKAARQSMDERLEEVIERGIIVRSVERGLVDFPSEREGRTVYLCWVAGEGEITQWHETDTGFAGRQPL